MVSVARFTDVKGTRLVGRITAESLRDPECSKDAFVDVSRCIRILGCSRSADLPAYVVLEREKGLHCGRVTETT